MPILVFRTHFFYLLSVFLASPHSGSEHGSSKSGDRVLLVSFLLLLSARSMGRNVIRPPHAKRYAGNSRYECTVEMKFINRGPRPFVCSWNLPPCSPCSDEQPKLSLEIYLNIGDFNTIFKRTSHSQNPLTPTNRDTQCNTLQVPEQKPSFSSPSS